ncbi:MAG: hypothetical protein ACNYPF_00730 [Candidatus Puniceispirillales bacterium WSBS_2018_MAG_OTU23]
MTTCSLTPSKVLTTKKRKKPYIIHDQKLKGFHLKIYPSGRKTFAITCRRGGRQYNERIGNAAVMPVVEARSIAMTKIDALTLTAKACKAGTGTSSLTNTSFSIVADVEIWFAGLSHITEAANRAVTVLSSIMQGAEELGLREEDSNPTLGLKRYKRYPRQCILTDMEMARLGKLPDVETGKTPRKSVQAAILRLIILTGCRKNEMRNR